MSKVGTNIEVTRVSDQVHKDEGGYFIYVGVKARPVEIVGIKFYVEDEFVVHLRSLHKPREDIKKE